MRKSISLIVAACFLAGCSTLRESSSRLEPLVESAAYTGASFDLMAHPERRPIYQAAFQALDVMVKNGDFDLIAFKTVLATLPINELRDAKTTILIDNAIIIFDHYAGQFFNLDNFKADFLGPIVTRVHAGLGRALDRSAPQPPTPPPTP